MRESGSDPIAEGRAWTDLSDRRKVAVSGPDAEAWLHDLVTASIEDLEPAAARRSLLLTPTGRIRADFTVARVGGGFLLVQAPDQPASILDLLSPYVLSSRVELHEADRRLLGFPNRAGAVRAEHYRPSSLGPGLDALPAGESEERGLVEGLEHVGPELVEAWRIARGEARFPVDLTTTSLPHEAGLDHAIAYGKGCFLGQEAVAKVRNLGHPPRVTLALAAEGEVRPGDAIRSGERDVGAVTSVAGEAAIGTVRWDARERPLATERGTELRSLGLASGAA